MYKKLKRSLQTAAVAAYCSVVSTSVFASLKPPSAPKLDGLTSGETNWILIARIVGENFILAAGLLVSGFLTLGVLVGICLAIYKEYISKEGGTGKILAGTVICAVVGMVLGAIVVNDLMTQLGQAQG